MKQETYEYDQGLNCSDKCLISLLTCKKYFEQYAVETTDNFRIRWNNYKDNTGKIKRRVNCQQRHLCEHFLEPEQIFYIEGVSITLIGKTDPFKSTKRERY